MFQKSLPDLSLRAPARTTLTLLWDHSPLQSPLTLPIPESNSLFVLVYQFMTGSGFLGLFTLLHATRHSQHLVLRILYVVVCYKSSPPTPTTPNFRTDSVHIPRIVMTIISTPFRIVFKFGKIYEIMNQSRGVKWLEERQSFFIVTIQECYP